ncbi:hypothetical protein Arub01_24840 [Actinomadura rubrobrunea]|uniref:Mycothiol-dependent maleylpyruvate isomerase metal-binding domain-containing protein n=1 Tax=Actinomadura rubrobrunea TaxID=115335 RepID=A0A9W6PTL0_9ACTN|nr:maleylpyruvate isomerase family mycothiol-dependent enzyme [Actinomadura rubrobrunea]GLW64240.1 hypothetical protein Arub01_24840 [Actinomadura rubrobrunea]
MESDILSGLNPFDIFDREAERLDAFFAELGPDDWDRPSRCAGWSVRDVLAHLAGAELYNHACLDDELDVLFNRLAKEGVSGVDGFNQWCVDTRRGLPVAGVLGEWRRQNGDTRRRMRERGADAMLPTMAGPYPVGLQAFHYASDYAAHADDVGVPVAEGEEPARSQWRARVARFVLAERGSPVRVEDVPGGVRVLLDGRAGGDAREARLSTSDFVEAAVNRLPDEHPLDPELRAALVCLA